ncbi:HPr kinase [Clostridium polyendosporum]|uniref:HPr kinase n=1 Tax=Clostridium polyendosporum TaxID=69208 RepID=A0A919S175_9CLOT|nr:hypothetical protein [Clostridium polyendosporum]GIM28733.1 HPr kinase [Clostridium polyendosporum]
MILDNEIVRKYTYKVYGMDIKSEIFLPELLPVSNKEDDYADVTISYGVMPKDIRHELENGQMYRFRKNEMWFSIKEVANYYIYNGNTIIVEPYLNGNMEYIKIFLLGSAFGMLLIQRDMVAIHGSTVIVDGQGVIFTGESGTGKSTLTAAFREKGYAFLADDVSVTSKGIDGVSIINPGYPQQKLCKDAMEKMGYDTDKFIMIDSDRDKYAIPVCNDFFKEAVSLGAVFELTVGEVNNVSINEIVGSEKLKVLLKNIYRIELTSYVGMSPSYFKNCIDIVKKIPLYRVIRPKNSFSVEQQIELITKTLRSINRKSI